MPSFSPAGLLSCFHPKPISKADWVMPERPDKGQLGGGETVTTTIVCLLRSHVHIYSTSMSLNPSDMTETFCVRFISVLCLTL